MKIKTLQTGKELWQKKSVEGVFRSEWKCKKIVDLEQLKERVDSGVLWRIPLKGRLTRQLIHLEIALKKCIRGDILKNSEHFKFIVKTLWLRVDFFQKRKWRCQRNVCALVK